MAREKEGYRENLELLNLRFPDHDLLTMEEVMQVTGYTDRRTIIKYLGKYIVNNRLIWSIPSPPIIVETEYSAVYSLATVR